MRGSTIRFYERLDRQKSGALPEGPPIWICGDCHTGNLGPIAGNDGNVNHEIAYLEHCRNYAMQQPLSQ